MPRLTLFVWLILIPAEAFASPPKWALVGATAKEGEMVSVRLVHRGVAIDYYDPRTDSHGRVGVHEIDCKDYTLDGTPPSEGTIGYTVLNWACGTAAERKLIELKATLYTISTVDRALEVMSAEIERAKAEKERVATEKAEKERVAAEIERNMAAAAERNAYEKAEKAGKERAERNAYEKAEKERAERRAAILAAGEEGCNKQVPLRTLEMRIANAGATVEYARDMFEYSELKYKVRDACRVQVLEEYASSNVLADQDLPAVNGNYKLCYYFGPFPKIHEVLVSGAHDQCKRLKFNNRYENTVTSVVYDSKSDTTRFTF